ncbi:MAG: hypothetical protein M3033_07730 [Acidobacteriota bacterium]|nr:hypothetical protein [Acidobacteriota bacterium]
MKKIINIKMLFALFLVIGWIGISAQEAKATHLRGVTLSWTPTGNPGEVEFRFLYSQRYSAGATTTIPIDFGDGTSGNTTGTVTSINNAEDYYIADLKVRHTYSGNGPYIAFYQNCCRISSLVNGHDDTIRLETTVTPRNGNSSPVASIPTVVTLPSQPLVTFSIPASDADGDRLRYRLATAAEKGSGTNSNPTGLSTDPNTGLLTWNTAGLNIAAGTLYSVQVMIEDLDANGNVKSKTPVDCLLKFVGNIGTPPTLAINPAGPLTVSANSPVTFTVTGNDADANARVTLNAAGMPTGATMSPAIGAQLSPPVTSTFNWTPTLAQAGPSGNTYVINFTATDENNNQALKSITINVLPVGAPTANSQSISAQAGVQQNVVLQATDPNGLNLTFSITGSPAHGTAVLDGSPSCSLSGGISTCMQNAHYTATAGYSGADSFTFRANNGVSSSNAAIVSITVAANLAPTVNCPANPAAVQYAAPNGATVPVTFQVGDPNGDALTLQWKVDGSIVNTDNVAASNSPTSVTFSEQYAVGTHTVQVIVTDPSNAQATSCVVQVSVTKGNQTITFGSLANKTYGDGDFPISAAANSNLPVSFAANGNCTTAGGIVHITGAGSCTITASQAGDGNYNSASAVSQTFNIAKAAPVINWTNPADIIYGTALGGTQLNATASFQSAPLTGNFAYTPAGGVLNAGMNQTLSVNFTPTDAANFNPASATVSINVLKAVLTIWADDKSKTYGGAAVSFTVTPTGFAGGDTMSALSGTLAFNFADAPNKPAGIYTITPSGVTSGNYDITFKNGNLTVSKAALTVTADNASKTYGAANPTFTAQFGGFVLSEGSSVLDGALVFNTAADQTSGVGSYAVTPAGLTSANYEVSFVAGTLQVNPAALTVKTNDASKTYGDAPFSFGVSYDGFVNGDTASSLSGTPAFDFADTVNTAAGSYTVTPAGLTSSNYNITFAGGTFAVSKAAITVTADDKVKTYGGASIEFTVSYLGLVNGDTAQSLVGSLGFNFADSPATTAGTHVITPSGITSPNYNVAFASGTLTVSAAQLMVTPADASRSYGAANPTFAGTIAGIQNGDDITANYNTTAAANSPIGAYAITAALNDAGNKLGNYQVTLNEGTLTVIKAALSVVADNASRGYGSANPVFTGKVSGAQNGEVINAVYATAATQASDAGTYAITPALSGATLGNYAITSSDGTLTITKVPQVIHWSNPANIVYGTPLGALQLNATVTVVGPSAAGALTYAPEAGRILNAGSAQVLSVSAAATQNYLPATASVVINVAKAPSVITASAPSLIVNGGSTTVSSILTGVGNSPLGNRPVTLTIGSGAAAQSCSAMTNAAGQANCNIAGINQPLGPNLAIQSSFAGDDNYLGSNGAATTLVFAYATSGSASGFVVGNQSAIIGRSVTFWGSQWAGQNTLSGGAAPSSFKGFANLASTNPPVCGGNWTTDPGASSLPPATVPQYMAVIVSSSITKSGSNISGNTPKVVIVKTDAGYGPSPSQTGSGTVVAVLCQ